MKEFFATSNYWKSLDPAPTFGMFNAGHITIIILMFIALALIMIFGRKINHKYIAIYIKIFAVFWVAMDVLKTTLFLTTSGDTIQALREALPIFMCSLFMYSLPFASFGKGKVKEVANYTICTLCLLSGLLTSINCPALNSYPMFSFYALHSLIYHVFMTLTGFLMLCSGYVKLEWKKFYLGMIPIAILSVPAIILNNAVNTDYMLMRFAWGTPVLQGIAPVIGQIPQIIFMYIIYLTMCFVMTWVAVGIEALYTKKSAQSPTSTQEQA